MYWVGDAWSVIYWTTFILAWAVIPILSGYLDSGYFTFKDRLKDALHEQVWMLSTNRPQYTNRHSLDLHVSYSPHLVHFQIRWGLVATGGLVGFIIYLLSQHYTLAKIEGFLIALGNTYGLMIIVVLLGNGLVEVPRRLYLYSDPNQVGTTRSCHYTKNISLSTSISLRKSTSLRKSISLSHQLDYTGDGNTWLLFLLIGHLDAVTFSRPVM